MRLAQALPMHVRLLDTRVLVGAGTHMKAAIRAAIYAVIFVAAIEAMITLARFGQNVTPIWIASAILAWALISSPTKDWLLVVGFAAAAHIARAAFYGDHPQTELIYLLANIGGPLACAALMRWLGVVLNFEDRRAVVNFLLIAGLAAPAVSTAIVTAGTMIDSRRFEVEDLDIWFLTEALSYVVFLPTFFSIANGAWRTLLAPRIRVRAIVLFGILIAALVAEWFIPVAWRSTFPTLLIPYLIYMTFELGMAGARGAVVVSTIGLLLYALFASEGARRGLAIEGYIVTVQVYLAALAACVLPLAAALAEKQKLYETASEALGDAQAAWGSLIAAEAHYRLIADNAADMVMRVDLEGIIIFASPACSLLSQDVHDLEGDDFGDLIHPDDAPQARANLLAFIGRGVLDVPYSISFRMKSAQGAWLPMNVRATLVGTRGPKPEELIIVLRQMTT